MYSNVLIFLFFLLGLFFLGHFLYRLYPGLLLNDVTTSVHNPPQFPSKKKILTLWECHLHQKFYSDLKPFKTKRSSKKVFNAVIQAINKTPRWTILRQSSHLKKIAVVATTPLFHFKDDLLIEVRDEENGYCSLHLRSCSRLGKGDLGKNARRIRKFLKKMEQILK